jgi:hypothetical protein
VGTRRERTGIGRKEREVQKRERRRGRERLAETERLKGDGNG